MINDVTDIIVYRVSMDLTQEVYLLSKTIPYSENSTIDQIKRSSKSIPANIAEGFAKRNSPKEFRRFLQIALGSSDETIVHLRLLYIAVPKLRDQIVALTEKYKVLSKRINKLRTSWPTY